MRGSGTDALHAESWASFWQTFQHCMFWPQEGLLVSGIALWAPAIALLSHVLWRKTARDETLLAALAWVLAHVLAVAWGRGWHGEGPASRYMDLLALGPLLNGVALWRLCSISRSWRFGAVVWAALLIVALGQRTATNVNDELPDIRHYRHVEETNVRGYLATEDADTWLRNRDNRLAIPYPDPDRLKSFLDDPTLRTLLSPAYLPPGPQPRENLSAALPIPSAQRQLHFPGGPLPRPVYRPGFVDPPRPGI